jgi:hypothetical protein
VQRIENLLELLDNYRKILRLTNSSLCTDALEGLIIQLKTVKHLTIEEISIKPKGEVIAKTKPSKSTFDLVKVKDSYKKLSSNGVLTEDERTILDKFEERYPRFRALLLGDNETIYAAVSKNEQTNLSVDELKLLLDLRFKIDVSSRKKTKIELYNELMKSLYQSSHFDSLKDNYTK